ncbi:MAG: hypothetical protein ACJAVI_002418 [Candidatus Azotimanducaceae bacterium]|jgi:hypothetical protein
MLTKDLLSKLAASMLDAKSPNRSGTSSVDVVLTYVGQMVSHDIVPPTSNTQPSREVTPTLNLDSIYGSSPLYTYRHFPEHTGLLGKDGKFKVGKSGDLKRIDGIAVIPEPRNDENQIVAQFHRFWQDLHNRIVEEEKANALKARSIVTRLFQLVVIEDLLAQCLDHRVFESIFRDNQRFLDASNWDDKIPSFFRFAAFRFGHSLVRPKYQLSEKPSRTIGELLRSGQPLITANKIDWVFFSEAGRMHSAPLDTHITPAMGKIPNDLLPTNNIAELNLAAGEATFPTTGAAMIDWLLAHPSGKAMQDQLGLTKLNSLKGASFEKVNSLTIDNLPLWPYILLEAEQSTSGNRLGVLGSLLNAEVLTRAIANADHSVYERGHFDPVIAKQSLGNVGEKILGRGHSVSSRGRTVIQKIAEYL